MEMATIDARHNITIADFILFNGTLVQVRMKEDDR